MGVIKAKMKNLANLESGKKGRKRKREGMS